MPVAEIIDQPEYRHNGDDQNKGIASLLRGGLAKKTKKIAITENARRQNEYSTGNEQDFREQQQLTLQKIAEIARQQHGRPQSGHEPDDFLTVPRRHFNSSKFVIVRSGPNITRAANASIQCFAPSRTAPGK